MQKQDTVCNFSEPSEYQGNLGNTFKMIRFSLEEAENRKGPKQNLGEFL